MQQEPMRSPANQDLISASTGDGDSEFMLTPEQEAAMLAEYGNNDDSQFDLQDPDDETNPKDDKNLEQKADPSSDLQHFRNHYIGNMDLLADKATVMKYLDAHQGWFRRCAHPFKADPIGETGYAMGIGKVGALGFQVDARVGLNLLPPDENCVYRIVTIPIPEQLPQGYEVDFQAEMRLEQKKLEPKAGEKLGNNPIITSIEWDLHLTVSLHFPAFIQQLAKDMIQKTGDSVLGFIVQRVSKSLTAKVQDDFHKTHEIKVPKQIKLRR
ncbi:DUF1997 domain-containing protein [Pseudanabaena minima]|uniref:DUF1997 domain-containing protein n=1 Tax=Pseudanabaena minima TaxID=890415 RepID=UPI003DA91063